MARTEKKTKIKGLPPKVLLTERDSTTGSYPMVVHGLPGGLPTLAPFSDQNVLNVTASNIYYGLGVPVTSIYTPSLSHLTTSLTGSGRVVAGITDEFITLSEYQSSRSFVPFLDSQQLAADARGFDAVDFYASGSIDGFKGPLWSKNKIEIDFTPSATSSLSGSGGGSPISYFNWATKRWQSQGTFNGVNVDYDNLGYKPMLLGFSPSLHTIRQDSLESKGRPISNFGFPFDSIFEATSASLFPVSSIINRPFVVEKIYVEMSASYLKATGTNVFIDAVDVNSDPLYGPSSGYSQASSSYVVNNFFILNQRKGTPTNTDVVFYDADDLANIYMLHNTNRNGTTRDLVTWFEIASFNDDFGYVTKSFGTASYHRDYSIVNSSSVNAFSSSWTANIKMSGSVRSPNYTAGNVVGYLNDTTHISDKAIPLAWLGSRCGIGGVKATGRDMKNPIGRWSQQNWSRENPYILMPGDQLIFGWQVPMWDYGLDGQIFNPAETNITASVITFAASPAKVVLYGSFMSEGVAVNSTLNQNLSSNSIHEAIE